MPVTAGRAALGYVGDKPHDDLVMELIKAEEHYRDVLSPTFQQMVENWRWYFGDHVDDRLPHEKDWRSNYYTSRPYSSIESQVAITVDILTSGERRIEPDPVGLEDEIGEHKISRALDFFTRRMRFDSKLDMASRVSSVQGIDIRKATWIDNKVTVMRGATPEEQEGFNKAIWEASQLGAGQPPQDDPENLLLWIDLVNQAGQFGQIPKPPVDGLQEVSLYRGPGWEYVPVYSARFDPLVHEGQRQEIWMQRAVKPEKWILAKAGDDDRLPYDEKAVREGLASNESDPNRFSDWEEQISRMLGIEYSRGESEDPVYAKKAEIFEIWRKGAQYPYVVLLNRKSIINKHPERMPYEHMQYPFHLLRNVLLPGHAVGFAEMVQNIPLFKEIQKLRNLRVDAVTLAVLPILMKLKEVGLPEMLRRLVPGMILDIGTIDGVRSLNEHIKVPEAVFREIPDLEAQADELQGTQDLVRGSAAPFSRTTAQEITKRLERALSRQIMRVKRIEGELSTVVPQWLFLAAQFGPPDWRLRVGGTDPTSRDPFQAYSMNEFIEAIEMDYRFRGATNAIDKELRTQQLGDHFARAIQSAELGVNSPMELRALSKRVYESMGHKGSGEIFTSEGDQLAALSGQAKLLELQSIMAQAQKAQQGEGEDEGLPPGTDGGVE
jgi:hypothetical protein